MAMMAMMDGQQEPPLAQLSSTYPSAPMEYVNMYTNENVRSGKAPVPPKIIKENYLCFGKPIDPNEVLILPLENQGIERLYSLADLNTTPKATTTTSGEDAKTIKPSPSDDAIVEAAAAASEAEIEKQTSSRCIMRAINTNNHKRELKKLNHSILAAYLDLLDILVCAPNTQIEIEQPAIPRQQLGGEGEGEAGDNQEGIARPNVILKTVREQKLGDLEILFINMHHLINELRPHQARDTLRCVLEMQRQQRIEMATKFKAHLLKIVDLLNRCIHSIEPKQLDKDLSSELETLISSAAKLTKSLDELSSAVDGEQVPLPSTQSHRKTRTSSDADKMFNNNNEDVEMRSSVEEVLMASSMSNKYDEDNGRDETSAEKRRRMRRKDDELKTSCDFRDLILCDLIDAEFNENEF